MGFSGALGKPVFSGWAGASGCEWLVGRKALGALALQPVLGLQEQVLL